jgi:2-iminobutanoate/2-iminopropanoate deaminase
MKKIITTEKAPKAIGPYSQAVLSNGMLFISGQLPIDPLTGKMANNIKDQTRQVLLNIKAILDEAGYNFDDVVKSTVLLKSIGDFTAMNEVYGEFYSSKAPARAAYEVANLPMGAMIEIETIAIRNCL